MKLRAIFHFEFGYQLRRYSTWLFFTALTATAFLFVRGNFLADAMYADFYLNSPFVIAAVTVFVSLFWTLAAGAVAGEAAARDVNTGMHPLMYAAPVSKAAYLGGRFLAAFALNALSMLAVPVGVVLVIYSPGVASEVIGPFRPAAYLTAYFYIALPTAFIGTAIQFAWATLGRRALASYLGSMVLFFVAYSGMAILGLFLERQDLALLLDVFAHVFITSDLILGWTPIEKSTRLIELRGALLASRLLWVGIASVALALTYTRFRFVHHTTGSWWSRCTRRDAAHAPTPASSASLRIPVPAFQRTFGFATHLRQTITITWTSFWTIAWRRAGFIVLAVMAFFVILLMPQNMKNMGTPLLPRTDYLLTLLTAPLGAFMTPWVVIPMLIVIYAGELVWREREAGTSEMTNAAPTPEWALFLGKFFGLGLFLATWMVVLTIAGVLVQLRMDYHAFEVGLYLRVLFGLQLPEYLLFAVLAFAVHVLMDQKYTAHLLALLLYASILFSFQLGVSHNLLVYGSHVGWSFSDMRGFGASLAPWAWFKIYWAAWALWLAVVARLFWVRGLTGNLRTRLKLARLRFTRATRCTAAVAAGLGLTVGGFIFYNTNILNEYVTAADARERRAEYERRYARFKDVPQPALTASKLLVEIYPETHAVEIRGTYNLVNHQAVAIDSVHLAIARGVYIVNMSFDRASTLAIADDDLGHRTHALKEPLRPGEPLQLNFEVHHVSRGFDNNGANTTVMSNGTFFESGDLQPTIGYQSRRELIKPGERRTHGLPARPVIPAVDDGAAAADVTGEAHEDMAADWRIAFEAVVGTDEGQIAVAPGTLRRTWNSGDRRYFHYVSDVPLGHDHRFFSASYAMREEQWQEVTIRILHHPTHTANVDRMLRSARASLEYYSEQFGPYPFGQLTLVENAGNKIGAHAEPAIIDYSQGFARFDPSDDPNSLDLPFAVMAHETAHQWWGAQLAYARREGVGLLTESAAWYSAMGVVERTYGREQVRRLLRFFRQPHPIPPIRQSVPLLRAADPYAAYRKGPFVLFAMSEYMGKERVNGAFRRLLEKHLSGSIPLPTSLDLYRELKAATPDSLQSLLHDFFEANTFWDLKTERPTALKTETGTWQVTIPVHARKVVVDPAGVETEVPMEQWVQIGVFAPTGEGADFGEQLYLQMHRIRTGEQTITVTVPREPSDAGIDPYHLLIDMERFDNVEEVRIES